MDSDDIVDVTEAVGETVSPDAENRRGQIVTALFGWAAATFLAFGLCAIVFGAAGWGSAALACATPLLGVAIKREMKRLRKARNT